MSRKLSRREELYGKKQNDDFGCLLMFLGGPLPFRLLSILFVSFVIILFQNFFSNDDSKSNPKDVYQYDHHLERTHEKVLSRQKQTGYLISGRAKVLPET